MDAVDKARLITTVGTGVLLAYQSYRTWRAIKAARKAARDLKVIREAAAKTAEHFSERAKEAEWAAGNHTVVDGEYIVEGVKS